MDDKILIYQAEDGSFQTEVRLEAETIWLTQKQMSELFNTSLDNISLHLKNIYKNQELAESSTIEEYSVVQKEGQRHVERRVKHYNLDAIISVGYRVNSKQGTQFRIWANQVLKNHLMEGYALNEKKLKSQKEQFKKLAQTLKLFEQAQSKVLSKDEATGLLSILTDYTHSFIWLNQYNR